MRGKITVTLMLLVAMGIFLRGFACEEELEPSVEAPAVNPLAEVRSGTTGKPPSRKVTTSGIPVPDFVLRHLPLSTDELEPLPMFVSQGSSSDIGVQLVGEMQISEEASSGIRSPLRIEYTFDAELTRRVRWILSRARAKLGHVIVMDPKTGRILAYVSTDENRFSPLRTYPAASLVKVVTAAATLHHAPEAADRDCRYSGSPYRLTRSRINPPKRGNATSFRRALAKSNNQCFAQYAVHELGRDRLLDAIDRFGFLREPAPGHAPGQIQPGEDELDLGKLGCGLAGCQITPLHAAVLASTLATGAQMQPVWIERVIDGLGRELSLPPPSPPREVLTPELAAELREMLVDTTQNGTARKAFRSLRGRPLLGSIKVAGKTGSLSGTNPKGRYEWFAGVAPASEPSVAIAVLIVQGDLYWRTASQIAAEVLKTFFCSEGECRSEAWAQWMPVDE